MYKTDVENDGFLALKLYVARLNHSCGFGLKIGLKSVWFENCLEGEYTNSFSDLHEPLRESNINYIVVEFWFDKPTYHGYFWLSKREFSYPLEPAFFSFTVETVSERTRKTTTCVQKPAILIEERDCQFKGLNSFKTSVSLIISDIDINECLYTLFRNIIE